MADFGGGIRSVAGMKNSDWRENLASESRQNILRRIGETLQRAMPDGGQDYRLQIAQQHEAQIFQTAADAQDYLRKISLKMLHYETQAANERANQGGHPP